MATPFAAIESATALNAVAALANAEAVIRGVTVTGMFDNASAISLGAVDGTQPQFRCATADLPSGVADGDAIEVDGVDYLVSAPPQHDGTGMTLLLLHEA